jgi:hypothetical protein
MAGPLKRFLRSLNDAGVDYAVVGGHAVAFHGNPRATQGLEVVYVQTEENARRLAKAVGRHIAVESHEVFLGPPDELIVIRYRGEKYRAQRTLWMTTPSDGARESGPSAVSTGAVHASAAAR